MTHYIDKDALIAEIERRIRELEPFRTEDNLRAHGAITGYYQVLSFIDTLEVKEVDLEKEIDDYINDHFSECDDGVLISDANSTELTLLDVTSIARHFFELGLKVAQKGI